VELDFLKEIYMLENVVEDLALSNWRRVFIEFFFRKLNLNSVKLGFDPF
jgi:hypothetical protein